jgi:hypothetical protein
VGAISAILFTLLVLLSSFITTYFMSWFQEPYEPYYRSPFSPFYFVSPFETAQDLIRAALRILRDEDGEDGSISGHGDTPFAQGDTQFAPRSEPGIIKSFIRRFLLGLPMIGVGS